MSFPREIFGSSGSCLKDRNLLSKGKKRWMRWRRRYTTCFPFILFPSTVAARSGTYLSTRPSGFVRELINTHTPIVGQSFVMAHYRIRYFLFAENKVLTTVRRDKRTKDDFWIHTCKRALNKNIFYSFSRLAWARRSKVSCLFPQSIRIPFPYLIFKKIGKRMELSHPCSFASESVLHKPINTVCKG